MKDGLLKFGADQAYADLSGVDFSNCRTAGATRDGLPFEDLPAAYRERKG